jgi:hypothetical protein
LPITIRLVPKPLWGINAHKLLDDSAWEEIRQVALAEAQHTCECCGFQPGQVVRVALICHEVWEYDEKAGTATLTGLRIHCRLCDLATHIGRAIRHGNKREAFTQLCKVNGLTAKQAVELYESEMAIWRARNLLKWRIAIVGSLLQSHPTLARLEAATANDARAASTEATLTAKPPKGEGAE